jgi:Tol biopolymer transport system component
MDADGTHVRRLTEASSGAENMTAVWSPDGTQIAFQQVSPERIWSIAVMDADGSNPRTLTQGDSIRWSPDSQQIMYATSAKGTSTINLMDRYGNPYSRVTHSEDRWYTAEWSPDGHWIIYSPYGDNQTIRLFAADPKGATAHNLLEQYWFATDRCCVIHWVWSPISDHITFALADDGTIYDVDVKSNAIRPLVYVGGSVLDIAWTPDGKRLLYSVGSAAYMGFQGLQGGKHGIFVWEVESGKTTELTTQDDYDYFSLSPDGQRFSVGMPNGAGFRVYKLDGTVTAIPFKSMNTAGVEWSPDSQHILGAFCTENDFDIYDIDTDTGVAQNLTAEDAFMNDVTEPTHCNQFG